MSKSANVTTRTTPDGETVFRFQLIDDNTVVDEFTCTQSDLFEKIDAALKSE